jgi:hypothetical protein
MISILISSISIVIIIITTSIIIIKGLDIKKQNDNNLKLINDKINNNNKKDIETINTITDVQNSYTSKEDIARSVNTKNLSAANGSINNITGDKLKYSNGYINTADGDKLRYNSIDFGSGILQKDVNNMNMKMTNNGSFNFKDQNNITNMSFHPSQGKINVTPEWSVGKQVPPNSDTFGADTNKFAINYNNQNLFGLYNSGDANVLNIDATDTSGFALTAGEADPLILFNNPSISGMVAGTSTPFNVLSKEFNIYSDNTNIANTAFSTDLDNSSANIVNDMSKEKKFMIYGNTSASTDGSIKSIGLNDNVYVKGSMNSTDIIANNSISIAGTSITKDGNIVTKNLNTSQGVSVGNKDPGPLIEKSYGTDDNRYGVGQWANGNTRLYAGTTTTSPGTVNLSLAKANNTFDDVVSIKPNRDVNISGNTNISANLSTTGRIDARNKIGVSSAGIETIDNADWMRIYGTNANGTAMYNGVSINGGGLNVGSLDKVPQGTLKTSGDVTVGGTIQAKSNISTNEKLCINNTCITEDNLKKILAMPGASDSSRPVQENNLRKRADLIAIAYYNALRDKTPNKTFQWDLIMKHFYIMGFLTGNYTSIYRRIAQNIDIFTKIYGGFPYEGKYRASDIIDFLEDYLKNVKIRNDITWDLVSAFDLELKVNNGTLDPTSEIATTYGLLPPDTLFFPPGMPATQVEIPRGKTALFDIKTESASAREMLDAAIALSK